MFDKRNEKKKTEIKYLFEENKKERERFAFILFGRKK